MRAWEHPRIIRAIVVDGDGNERAPTVGHGQRQSRQAPRWIVGKRAPSRDAPTRCSCMVLSVSGLVMEGAGGEIRRLREMAGRLTGQASPVSSIAMGGSRRR